MKRILDVGNCDPDHSFISSALSSLDAEVIRVHSAAEAISRIDAESFDLVLVNRVFDRDGGSGLDLIQTIESAENGPATLLISNYAEAQEQAKSHGAKEGFGKAEGGDAIRTRVEAALNGG